jgi:hypothetical protein
MPVPLKAGEYPLIVIGGLFEPRYNGYFLLANFDEPDFTLIIPFCLISNLKGGTIWLNYQHQFELPLNLSTGKSKKCDSLFKDYKGKY